MSAIYALLSAARTQEKSLESTSNNLANANTAAFKADKPVFEEYLKNSVGKGNPSDVEEFMHDDKLPAHSRGLTKYAFTSDVVADMSPGGFKKTDSQYDFAIKGNGFFTVETAYGRRYTRDGQFTRSADGYLTDVNGNYVLGGSGRIKVEGTSLTVTNAGLVSVDGLFVDQLQIKGFENQAKLTKVGDNYYTPSIGQKEMDLHGNFSIEQGIVEESNVSVVKEMTNLITTNRSFDAAQRGIKTIDALDEQSLTLAR